MKTITLFAFFSFGITGYAQEFEVSAITELDGGLNETSGLIWIDERTITHNDSGGGNFLYEIDTTTGLITRTVCIANAGSSDWEDICYDDNHIYVADIGNNAGTRTDLRIYRILITDYLTTLNDTVYAEFINFSYADQIDFSPAVYETNYDAEALISIEDSLYLFTKNWGNSKSNIYAIPKIPGTYSASIIDSINTEGLVTGAAYDPEKKEILLSGYTLLNPFVFLIRGFEGSNFSEGTLKRAAPSFSGSYQIESCASLGNHKFLISSEDHISGASTLHQVCVIGFSSVFDQQPYAIRVYPNPASESITLEGCENGTYFIYDLKGTLLITGSQKVIDLHMIKSGTYILQLKDADQALVHSQLIVKH